MRLDIRCFLILTSIVTAASIGLSQSQRARDVVQTVRDYFQREEVGETGGKTSAQLEIEARQTGQRLAIKRSLTHDLIEGRIDLECATEIFMELNNLPPCSSAARLIFPNCCEKEATAMQVMLHVRSYLEENPAFGTGGVLARLEAELEDLRIGLGSAEVADMRFR